MEHVHGQVHAANAKGEQVFLDRGTHQEGRGAGHDTGGGGHPGKHCVRGDRLCARNAQGGRHVSAQVAEYKEGLDQNTLLAVLEGIFAMTDAKSKEFVDAHTTEIDGAMTPTTLNSATNKACGANKKKFSLVFMHSDVATNLENLQLLEYLKYTDTSGITRDLAIATWNGKLVVVDDYLPTEVVAESSSGANDGYTKYTTYVLGDGAIDFEDVGVKVPYEMDRDPAKNGGEDTLYMRQRKVFAPKGISYEKKSQASLSPTDAELKNGANWALVHSGESTASQRSYINHKAIPIARIISRG